MPLIDVQENVRVTLYSLKTMEPIDLRHIKFKDKHFYYATFKSRLGFQ